jgi:TRAP-type mannitol/chloroaromatic compound transport system permease small subunit
VNKLIPILNTVDAINYWVGKVLSFSVLFIFVFMIIEVTQRYIFNSPTVWANELGQYIFGVYAILSGGYILKSGGHVNVDIIYGRFSTKGKAIVDIMTFSIFFVFCVIILVYGGSLAWESLSILEHSRSAWNPPLYPVKLMIPTGGFLLLIQGITKLVRDIIMVATGGKISIRERRRKETI